MAGLDRRERHWGPIPTLSLSAGAESETGRGAVPPRKWLTLKKHILVERNRVPASGTMKLKKMHHTQATFSRSGSCTCHVLSKPDGTGMGSVSARTKWQLRRLH